MDISKLSPTELKDLRKKIDQELENREQQQRKEALRKIQEIADAAGLSLEEITSGKRTQSRSTAKVKYRDPENPSNTWAGRGRKPIWLDEKLRQGRSVEEFAV